MKNKVVLFFLKVYKKFFSKKMQHDRSKPEYIHLQLNERLKSQIKDKENTMESDLPGATRNELGKTLKNAKKSSSDYAEEKNELITKNKNSTEFPLEILKFEDSYNDYKIESSDFSENVRADSISEIQRIQEKNGQEEKNQYFEGYGKISEKAELKVDDEVGDQIKEKETINQSPHIYTRAELEKLYEDHEELIIQPAKKSCFDSLKLIKGDSKFIRLRNKIYEKFSEITLLCEIEIDDEEYELLCDYFRKKYLELRRNDGKCPEDVLFCVALVQMGVRTYDGKFWEHISEILWHHNRKQIPANQHEWVGGLFTKTMLTFGKPIYKKSEYVYNVLMHCFVTDSFANKFFDFLYSFYNIDLKRDISTDFDEICDYICDSIKNPFGKRKQLLSKYIFLSIRADRKYCKEIIKTILRLIDQAFWNEFYEDFNRTGLIEKFFVWCNSTEFIKELQKERRGGCRKEKQFRTPYMKSFLDTNTFQLILPAQLLPSYIENARVYWKIEGRRSLNFCCETEEGYSGKRTKEIFINLPPLEIFDEYMIYFYINENPIRRYHLSETVAVFFNEDGVNIKGAFLSKGEYYAYVKPSSVIKTEGILNVRKRAGLNFYELNLDYGNVVFINDKARCYVGKLLKEGVTKDYLIHSMYIKNGEQKLEVYYRLPAILLEIEPYQINGTAVVINDCVTKLTDKELYEIEAEGNYEKKHFYLNLNRISEIHVGINKIFIDFPGTTRQLKFEFVYLPNFFYSFEDAPYFYVNRGTLVVNRAIRKDTISFNKIVDAQRYDFQFDSIVSDKLKLKIEINQQQYEVYFDIPVLQYSWDNVQWEIKRPRDIWHSELQDILYIKYPAEQIMLTVKPSDTECPSFAFEKNVSGIFQCDLVRIRSYLNEDKFVNNIFLTSNGQERKLFSIIMKSLLRGVTFEIDNEKECVYANFDIIGKGNYFIDVFCNNNEKVLEKQSVNVGINPLNIALDSSKYLVKVYENEGDFFSFDEDYKFVGEKEISLVNPLHLTESCFSIDLIVYDDHTQQLELTSKYSLFFLEKIGKRQYIAVLTEVFHKNRMYKASKVIVTIPDLNNISEVYIEFIEATYGEQNAFLYDNYKKCIVEEESTRYSKSEAYRRYEHVLYPGDYIWIIHNIPWNKVILEKAKKWLENSHKRKYKNNSIWKDDN